MCKSFFEFSVFLYNLQKISSINLYTFTIPARRCEPPLSLTTGQTRPDPVKRKSGLRKQKVTARYASMKTPAAIEKEIQLL